MSTEKTVNSNENRYLDRAMVFGVLFKEAHKCFVDESLYKHFVETGINEFLRFPDAGIGDIVLTPVSVLFIDKTKLPLLYKTWAGEMRKDDEGTDEMRADFAFIIGFFRKMTELPSIQKHFTETEVMEIINSTIAFTQKITEELMKKKFEDLM